MERITVIPLRVMTDGEIAAEQPEMSQRAVELSVQCEERWRSITPDLQAAIQDGSSPGKLLVTPEAERALIKDLASLSERDMKHFHYLGDRVRAIVQFRRWRRGCSPLAKRRRPYVTGDFAFTEAALNAHYSLLTQNSWEGWGQKWGPWGWRQDDDVKLRSDEIRQLAALSEADWQALCELEHRYLDVLTRPIP